MTLLSRRLVTIAAITNGREWRFFTDLHNKNVMDGEPFLTIDFEALDEALIGRLYRFRHDEFQPDALRTLAEETVYLNAFTDVISHSLREPDQDFVRYVANRANVQRQLNARFLEAITPIVKQAVGRSVSDMVVTGLSARPAPVEGTPAEPAPATPDPTADVVDLANPRIVTTYAERRLFEVVQDIIGDGVEIVPRDTESYFSVLYQGRVTRWLIRYYADRKNPFVQVCVPMTEERKREVSRAGLQFGASDAIQLPQPEHLLRIPGIVFDTFEYCRDDGNFKRGATAVG